MKRIAILFLIANMLMLAACGSSEEEEVDTSVIALAEGSDYSFLNGMEDGNIYVLHNDNTFEPIIFNNATFNYGSLPSSPNPNRIIWFKEDFKDIPTLHARDGDKLVLYSTSSVNEKIGLERFEDIGVSVGLCHLKISASGKCTCSTRVDDKCSYPGSDADAILNFINSNVIIDSIQGIPIRQKPEKVEEENQVTYDGSKNKSITKYGTITGLLEDNYYDLLIYDGTIKNTIKLKSDVHIMGSCQIFSGMNFHFLDDYIIEYELPQGLHTGYYNIQGMGLFRYIAKEDTFSSTTDYNIGIAEEKVAEKEDSDEGKQMVDVDKSKTIYGDSSDIDEAKAAAKEATEKLELDDTEDKSDTKDTDNTDKDEETKTEDNEPDVQEETYEITAGDTYIRFQVSLSGDEDAVNAASGEITSPDGTTTPLNRVKTTGDLYADIYSESGGQFKIVLNNAKDLSPDISATTISESEVKNGDIE